MFFPYLQLHRGIIVFSKVYRMYGFYNVQVYSLMSFDSCKHFSSYYYNQDNRTFFISLLPLLSSPALTLPYRLQLLICCVISQKQLHFLLVYINESIHRIWVPLLSIMICHGLCHDRASQLELVVKNPPANAGDVESRV